MRFSCEWCINNFHVWLVFWKLSPLFLYYINTSALITHCLGIQKSTNMWRFPFLIPLSFLSVWRKSWRGHARQMEATRYICCSVLSKTSQTFNFPIENDWKHFPSSQKETKSSPLAHVNDKEAESSKGKQNSSLNKAAFYKTSSSDGGKSLHTTSL